MSLLDRLPFATADRPVAFSVTNSLTDMAALAPTTLEASQDFLIKRVGTKANADLIKTALAAFVGGDTVVYRLHGKDAGLKEAKQEDVLRRMVAATRTLLERGILKPENDSEPRIRTCNVADGTLVDITFYIPGDDAVKMPFVLRYYHGRQTVTYHMPVGPESFDCRETFVEHVSNVLDSLYFED
jgi:hypothetical protein